MKRAGLPGYDKSESRTCHEANVRPGVNKWVTSFPHLRVDPRYITGVSENLNQALCVDVGYESDSPDKVWFS